MKKFFLFAALLLALVPFVFGQSPSVTLAWDASATPNVSYNVYRSKQVDGCLVVPQTACTKVGTTAQLTFTDTAFGVSGRWFYYVAAIDADGIESVFGMVQQPAPPGSSNVALAVTLHPAPPVGVRKGS